jgi:hypothetical protein
MSEAVACPPASHTYLRRSPELTPCYQIMADHWLSFKAQRQAEDHAIPEYIEKDIDEYLRCGIVQYGFLKLQCSCCQKTHITAFSCKKRGFCPSCYAKRMAETAAHLVDAVLPIAPYRQFVITLPIALRYWAHTNAELRKKIHRIIISSINLHYESKIKSCKTGQISFTQRFGSALSLNLHWHVLALDGGYVENSEEEWKFQNPKTPLSTKELEAIFDRIINKTLAHLKKLGLIDGEGEITDHPGCDPLFNENYLSAVTKASSTSTIAFGPMAGSRVTKVGSAMGYDEEAIHRKAPLCLSKNGFTIHASTKVNPLNRKELEKLIRYIARGPVANERLKYDKDKNTVTLTLKRAFDDGTTKLVMSPHTFIEKITAIIPPPKFHLVTWHGVFACNSSLKNIVRLKPKEKKGFCFDEEGKKTKNYTWSKMLSRVFQIDVLKCPCGGELKPIAAIFEQAQIERFLTHINISPRPPPIAPARVVQNEFDW